MKRPHLAAAFAVGAALCAVPSAHADVIEIDFDIANSVSNNFAYSVLHTPANANGNGTAIYRMVDGTFSAQFDDVANTLTMTSFQTDLYDGISVTDPSVLGNNVGSLSLVSGVFNYNDSTGLIGGDLTLDMVVGGVSEIMTFHFEAIQYNGVANTFDPTALLLGLWGATPDIFGDDWDGTSLGMDLVGHGTIVPLPEALVLGMAGLGMAGIAARRRRRSAEIATA